MRPWWVEVVTGYYDEYLMRNEAFEDQEVIYFNSNLWCVAFTKQTYIYTNIEMGSPVY